LLIALVTGLIVTGASLVTRSGTASYAAASPNELVSIAPGSTGPILQNDNAIPSITGDGSIVAFTNYASAVGFVGTADGVAAAAQVDTRGSYLRDRAAKATTAVRTLPPSFVGDTGAVISRDGCHVAFQAQGVVQGPAGVYVADRCPQSNGVRLATSRPSPSPRRADSSPGRPTTTASGTCTSSTVRRTPSRRSRWRGPTPSRASPTRPAARSGWSS
jgi:hypothetical protein